MAFLTRRRRPKPSPQASRRRQASGTRQGHRAAQLPGTQAKPAAPCTRQTLCPRPVGAWHRSKLRFDLARRLDARRIAADQCGSLLGCHINFFAFDRQRLLGVQPRQVFPPTLRISIGHVECLSDAHVLLRLAPSAIENDGRR